MVYLLLSDAEKAMIEAIADDLGLTQVAALRSLIRREFQALEKEKQ